MKDSYIERPAERGGAGAKFLIVAVVLVLLANAGYNYIPVAYEGASFKQEMDTAVVKGLASFGQLKPADIVSAHLKKAAYDYNLPPDAVIDIQATAKKLSATASYSKQVNILPFGIYKYKYQFDYTATPSGYLANDSKQ